MESNNSLKDQLARLQEDLAVRFPDNSDDLDEFAPEDEFDEYEELAELYPQIQPENEYPLEDPAGFKPWRQRRPGAYDDDRFSALPRPRWPNPRSPVTPEVNAAYRAEQNLCIEAGSRLLLFVNWLRQEKRWAEMMPPPMEGEETRLAYDRARYGDAEQLAAEHLAWLTGLWRSRGIPVPSIEELENMRTVKAE